MLWTIFVLLLILWVLGVVSSYTLGGFIHLLLILAIAGGADSRDSREKPRLGYFFRPRTRSAFSL